MSIKNSYPELPYVPYQNIVLDPKQAIDCLHDFDEFPHTVLCAALTISWNETGGFKSVVGGVLNGIQRFNAAGFQSDSGRWKNNEKIPFCAQTIKDENMTGHARGFLLFDTLGDSLYMLAYELNAREIYIGANGVETAKELATKYWDVWVLGEPGAVMPQAEQDDFVQLYDKCAAMV